MRCSAAVGATHKQREKVHPLPALPAPFSRQAGREPPNRGGQRASAHAGVDSITPAGHDGGHLAALTPRRRLARRAKRLALAGVSSPRVHALGWSSYLVDPASSHMLVSKIKPCMSKYTPLHGKTANGSLNQLWFLRSYNPTWITVAILELIHATKLRPLRGRALLLVQNQCRLSGAG